MAFDATCCVPGLYRPFPTQWLYFNRRRHEMVYQMPRIFPDAAAKNVVIGVSASDSRSAYSVFISDHVASLHAVDMVGSQYFPLYLYDDPEARATEASPKQSALFCTKSPSATARTGKRRDAITAEGLAHFQSAYPGESIGREDVFYYVYGLLHSPDYRERFADNLGKELPRIPRVKTAADFWAFSQAGRKLADLHLNYEGVEPYPLKIDSGGKKLTDADYRVEKMRYGKKGKDKDLTTLHYNDRITLTGIPMEAYDYVVNGKPALDWVVERQGVKTDKDSGIVNDANDLAVETMGNPRYPLELFQRVVTVSLETRKIVKALPQLDIASEGK
jgi:predicted helicase